MLKRRGKFIFIALSTLVAIWLVAMVAHWFFEGRKMTAEKIRAFIESVEYGSLTGSSRSNAVVELAAKLNALPVEERQKLRSDHLMNSWFPQMTEDEKTQFVEATLPAGIKQMITAFEQLPEEKRRKAIDDALKHLRSDSQRAVLDGRGNPPPPVSPELEARIRNIGLKAFYSQSSAQTKAEIAPLLEELQRAMESGRVFHR